MMAFAASAEVVAFSSSDDVNGGTKGNVKFAFASDTYELKESAKDPFTHYLTGKNNPKVDGADYTTESATAPNSGSVLLLTPSSDGVLNVYVVCNNDKKVFVTENGVAKNFKAGVDEMKPADTFSAKYTGYLTINVTAGKTYAFFCNGSKMGFYGYELDTTTALENVEATSVKAGKKMVNGKLVIEKDGVTYNVFGQKM